jgi:hypothetical protein
MSINNATPQDWDRLRKQHPPIEMPIDELLKRYVDTAQEEFDGYDENGYAVKVSREDWDAVNSPNHYNNGSIECIEGIQASMSDEAFAGYLKGNCMKYLWRYDYKGKPVEDLQKAQWYLARLLGEVVFDNEED